MVKANHSRKKSIFFLFGAHNKSSIALGHEWHFIITIHVFKMTLGIKTYH